MSNKYFEDTSLSVRREEIDIKVKRITDFLEKEGLNALYLTRQANFSWITAGGNNVVTICTEDGVAAILITKDGDRYCITNVVEAQKMIEEEQLEELGFKVLSQAWNENKNADYIRQYAGDLSKVGSDIYFEDTQMVQDKIAPLRWSLTWSEICRYQTLGDVMSEAMEEYLATVKPGMTEYEVTAGMAHALWPHQIGQTLFLVASDERIDKHRHAVPTNKKIEKVLMVSCNGRYKGLITTTTRMVCFGEPSKELAYQHAKNIEIECRMIAATRPGVDELVPQQVGKAGYEEFGWGADYYKHYQGGPQGYYNREYSVHEGMHNKTMINECYCYNPAIDGTKTEDAFIAMEDGPLFITKPKSFPKVTHTIDGFTMERPGLLIIE